MQALELKAAIDDKHQIHLQLPTSVKPQTAKIIVMYEDAPESVKPGKRGFGQFLGKVHMADDFNAKLPEAFWLGKNA